MIEQPCADLKPRFPAPQAYLSLGVGYEQATPDDFDAEFESLGASSAPFLRLLEQNTLDEWAEKLLHFYCTHLTNGGTHAEQETIAEIVGCSTTTLREARQALMFHGFVTVRHRIRQSFLVKVTPGAYDAWMTFKSLRTQREIHRKRTAKAAKFSTQTKRGKPKSVKVRRTIDLGKGPKDLNTTHASHVVETIASHPEKQSTSRSFSQNTKQATRAVVAVENMEKNHEATTGETESPRLLSQTLPEVPSEAKPLANTQPEPSAPKTSKASTGETTATKESSRESLAIKGSYPEQGADDVAKAVSELEQGWPARKQPSPEEAMIGMLVAEGVATAQASKIVREFGADRISRNLALGTHTNAKNPAGFLSAAIRHDYAASARPGNRQTAPARPFGVDIEQLRAIERRERGEIEDRIAEGENAKAIMALLAQKMPQSPMISGSFAAVAPVAPKPVEKAIEMPQKPAHVMPPIHPVTAKYNALSVPEKAMLRENILAAMDRVEAKTAAALRSESPPEYAVRKLAGAIADRLKARGERIDYDVRAEPLATIFRDVGVIC